MKKKTRGSFKKRCGMPRRQRKNLCVCLKKKKAQTGRSCLFFFFKMSHIVHCSNFFEKSRFQFFNPQILFF